MANNELLENAQSLYNDGKYSDALENCVSMLNLGIDVKTASVIAAKCILFTLPTPIGAEKGTHAIFNLVASACNEADGIDEVISIEQDVQAALCKWQEQNMKMLLAELKAKPTTESYRAYYPAKPEYIGISLMIEASAANSSVAKKYCDENNIQYCDYKSQRGIKNPERISDAKVAELEIETGTNIFNNWKHIIEVRSNGNSDFIKELSCSALMAFMVSELTIGLTISDRDNETPPEVKAERMKLQAKIIAYTLNCTINNNGKPMSLVCNDDARKKVISKLSKMYEQIVKLDPSFVTPPLPDEAPIRIQKEGNSSSGGCYVATAVYGSYDCPEVWTLRRFRDNVLAKTWHGRAFVHIYYAISPTLVRWFGHMAWFKNIWKPALDRMVFKLNATGVANTPYNDRSW